MGCWGREGRAGWGRDVRTVGEQAARRAWNEDRQGLNKSGAWLSERPRKSSYFERLFLHGSSPTDPAGHRPPARKRESRSRKGEGKGVTRVSCRMSSSYSPLHLKPLFLPSPPAPAPLIALLGWETSGPSWQIPPQDLPSSLQAETLADHSQEGGPRPNCDRTAVGAGGATGGLTCLEVAEASTPHPHSRPRSAQARSGADFSVY